MNAEEIPDVTAEQLDAILRFLPVFEQPGFVFGDWQQRPNQWPLYHLAPEVSEFQSALYKQQIVIRFNWPDWKKEAQRYVSDPEALAGADLLTLRKLLTTHLRADRFIGGHLVSMLESGHIAAILRRLQSLREQIE